ncbi:hypothetical protein GCM10010347_42610 [Streptomyces cirratus]|uniref:Lipoprotein n=1 Tax=Streptomyces cirratus TaxID=68187 RepID=A0ABQ3EW73_9ACTN|nr:hypothetical protein [Streptomyces cirratus]GHB67968.1 hypothetical protein GCM10010347_42610 [Streptomyces cirratus]
MRAVRRQAAMAALAVCGVLALTACQNGDDLAAPDAKPTAVAPAPPTATAPPTASATAAVPAPSKTGAAPKPSATATPAGKNPPAPAPPPAPTCGADHRMPVSPDTIAVHRYTPEGGMTSLIVQHGTYGCPGRFEPSGEWTYIPIAETAKITATAPILTTVVMGRPISTSELTGWLDTHPDKGLPFRYHLNAAGVIDTLDEIYVK